MLSEVNALPTEYRNGLADQSEGNLRKAFELLCWKKELEFTRCWEVGDGHSKQKNLQIQRHEGVWHIPALTRS